MVEEEEERGFEVEGNKFELKMPALLARPAAPATTLFLPCNVWNRLVSCSILLRGCSLASDPRETFATLLETSGPVRDLRLIAPEEVVVSIEDEVGAVAND